MLVHVVSWGGVAVVGSKDIMAVSRAWGHGFASFRRLHYVSSVPFPSSRFLTTFEPIVPRNLISSRHLRFIAHAAALEESPELHHKKGGRLSRAERFVLVENFVLRHKDANEGKWPSMNTILKEIGGSRLIVRDIVEELEKNSEVQKGPESSNGEEVHAALTLKHELEQVASRDADPGHSVEDLKATGSDLESFPDEPLVPTSDLASSSSRQSEPRLEDIETGANLWSSLRDYDNVAQNLQEARWDSFSRDAQGPSPGLDRYDSSSDTEDFSEQPPYSDDYEETKDLEQHDAAGLGPTRAKPSSGRYSPEVMSGESYGLFIRFLPLAATEADLRAAFQDCGEIVRAQAMTPKTLGLKFTYGFVDFSTQEGLSKALKKERVLIKGSRILTEACSGSRRLESTKSSSIRKPVPEHLKKGEAHRNSERSFDGRPPNGTRSSVASRFKRIDALTPSENGTRSLLNNESYFVLVEGLPYPMPISAVEKMLSAHGDISRSELMREDGGTYSAHVEFKTEEGREGALASSRVYLGGRWCRISTGEPILTTVIRLSNVGNASEGFILQRCGKIGRVDNIVMRKEGLVDVYFHRSERRNMRRILDRLGDVNAHFKRWHATLAPKCSVEEMRNSAEMKYWVEQQKVKLLDNLTGAMKLLIIDLEDLRELVEAEPSDVHNSGKPGNFDGY